MDVRATRHATAWSRRVRGPGKDIGPRQTPQATDAMLISSSPNPNRLQPHRRTDREALHVVDADLAQLVHRLDALDRFGDHLLAHDVADVGDGADHFVV